jgi:hypothetical protein
VGGEGWGRWPKPCFPGVWLKGIGDAFRAAVLRVWSSNSLNVTSTPESRRAFGAASFQAFFASACAPESRDVLYSSSVRIAGYTPGTLRWGCVFGLNHGCSYNEPMISPTNLGLELHDSVLHSVMQVGQTCRIALRPAYLYEVNAASGEVGTCMRQDAVLEFDHGSVDGSLGDLPDPILDGSLSVGSKLIEDLIPAPFEAKESVTLKLFLWPDYREIVISAQGLTVRLEGVPAQEKSPPSS